MDAQSLCTISFAFSFTVSTNFQNYFGSHLYLPPSFQEGLYICNTIRWFCHILPFILISFNFPDEVLKFAHTKVHSLSFKVLWVLTNASCHVSAIRVSYKMVFTTPQVPYTSSTQPLSPLPMPLTIGNGFTVSLVFPLPESMWLESCSYLAFSDWLL